MTIPDPIALYERARRFLEEDIWRQQRGRPHARGRRVLQLAVAIAEGSARHQILMRAHSLTYISLLSMIPLLALVVALGEAIGVTDRLLEFVLAQVHAVVPEAADFLRERVSQVKFGGLGTLGAAMLLIGTLAAIGNVEKTFNHIFGVRQRSVARRFPDYLAVVIVVPLVFGVAVSLGTTLRSQTVVRWLLEQPALEAFYYSGLRFLPALLFVLGFAFLYWFLPNTKVGLRSGLLGGLVAGLLFFATQNLYVALSVGAARYNALFGGLAFLPLLIVWIYVSWVIVLLGAEVTFVHQNLAHLQREVRGPVPSAGDRERIGLAVALQVAGRFREAGPPWNAETLADELWIPVRAVTEVLTRLEAAGIVAERGDESPAVYQLARPAEAIHVADVLQALRGPAAVEFGDGPLAREVQRTFRTLDEAEQKGGARDTLADLLERCAST